MKVFEVIIDRFDDTGTVTTHQYVTAQSNTIKAVTDHFTQWCLDMDQELRSVREVLVIVEHIDQ